jgi:hypothetical protein
LVPAGRFNAPRGGDEAILSPAQLVSSSPSSSIWSWEKYPKGWPAPGIAWLVVSTTMAPRPVFSNATEAIAEIGLALSLCPGWYVTVFGYHTM